MLAQEAADAKKRKKDEELAERKRKAAEAQAAAAAKEAKRREEAELRERKARGEAPPTPSPPAATLAAPGPVAGGIQVVLGPDQQMPAGALTVISQETSDEFKATMADVKALKKEMTELRDRLLQEASAAVVRHEEDKRNHDLTSAGLSSLETDLATTKQQLAAVESALAKTRADLAKETERASKAEAALKDLLSAGIPVSPVSSPASHPPGPVSLMVPSLSATKAVASPIATSGAGLLASFFGSSTMAHPEPVPPPQATTLALPGPPAPPPAAPASTTVAVVPTPAPAPTPAEHKTGGFLSIFTSLGAKSEKTKEPAPLLQPKNETSLENLRTAVDNIVKHFRKATEDSEMRSLGNDSLNKRIVKLVRGGLSTALAQVLGWGFLSFRLLGRYHFYDFFSMIEANDGNRLAFISLANGLEAVNATHDPIKKDNKDAKFRSLLCFALNDGQLHNWIEMMNDEQKAVQKLFEPWSFLRVTEYRMEVSSILSVLAEFPFTLNLTFEISQWDL
jgi:hypothetical protein